SLNSSTIGSTANLAPGQQRPVDTVLRIDQPFERGDKRALRLDAAAGLTRAAQGDSLDVLRQQLAALQGAYYDLKSAQEKAQALSESAQLFSGILSAAQRRLKAGDLAPADVAKVQVDYERAQNDARSAQADVVRAQIALGYMLGLDGSELGELRAADPWPATQRADPAGVEQAIESRPDVLAAKARVEAADK